MAMDWDAYFGGGSPVAAKSPDKIDWDSYFSLPNQEPSGPPKVPDWRDAEARANLEAIQGPRPQPAAGYTGSVLPFRIDAQGNRSLAVPTGISDPLTLPGDVYNRGKGVSEVSPGRTLGFAAGVAFGSPFGGPKVAPVDAALAKPTGAEATADMLKSAGRTMNVGKQVEGTVPHADLRTAMSNLQTEMKNATIRPHEKLTPAANDLYGRLLNLVRAPKQDPLNRLGFASKAPVPMTEATMQQLQELSQIADDVIGKGYNPVTKSYNSEGKLGVMMKGTIEEMMAKHPGYDLLASGKSEYSRGLQSRSLLKLIEQAKDTTQWDRGDHAGAIRNKVNSFLKTKDARYLSKENIQELRRIKRYGFTDALAGQGSLSPMQLTIGRILEGMFGIPPGGLYIAGKVAREANNAAKPAQIERLAQKIREGQ